LGRLRWYDADGVEAPQTGDPHFEKKGMALIEQPVKMTVTVDQAPLKPGKVKIGARSPEEPEPVSIKLTGHMVRSVPARMVSPVEERPSGAARPSAPEQRPVPDQHPAVPERLLDWRPFKVSGNDYYLLGYDGAEAFHVMRDAFVEKLGKAYEWEIDRQLRQQWSASMRHAPYNFQRTIGDEGYEIRISAGKQEATARVRMGFSSDPQVGNVGGAEISHVNRSDRTVGWSAALGRLRPVNGGVEVKNGVTGLGIKRSSGVQASESISDNTGHRIETSKFSETDQAATTELDGTLKIDISHGGKVIQLTAQSKVHLVAGGHVIDDGRARQEAGDPRGPAWEPHARPKRSWWPTGNPKWDHVVADPAKPSAPLTRALIQACLDKAEVRIEVHSEGDRTRRYIARPDGPDVTLHSGDEWTDGGFAEAFAGMPPPLAPFADEHGIDIRRVFEQSPVPGSLADKVRAELTNRGVALSPEHAPPRLSASKGGGRTHDQQGGFPGEGVSAPGGAGGVGGGG
jgi:hypothetical protein